MRRLLAALIVLAAGAIVTAAVAGELEEYDSWTSGVWHGTAHRDDQSHEFSHCAITRDYPNGMSLVYWWTAADEFQLVLVDLDWALGDGQRFPLAIAVDDKSLGRFDGVSSGDILLFVDFGNRPETVVDAMKRGNRLWVQGGAHDYSFPLADTFRGIDALEACARRGMRTASGSDVGDPTAAASSSALFDRPFVIDLLREAGVDDPRFLSADEIRDMPGVRHAWFHADTLGYVMEFDWTLATATDEMRDYMASLADDCGGRHSEDILEPRATQGAVVQQGISTCRDDGGFLSSHFTGVFPAEGGTVTIIGLLANEPEDDMAMTINDAISDALVRRFRGG